MKNNMCKCGAQLQPSGIVLEDNIDYEVFDRSKIEILNCIKCGKRYNFYHGHSFNDLFIEDDEAVFGE